MHYDLTLKQLLEGQPSRLLQRLTGSTQFLSVNMEWPNIRRRLPDLVLLLPNNILHHLEIQSGSDAQMQWRMLEYYLLLRQRFPDAAIIQQVLYVGQKPHRFSTEIQDAQLQFRYQVTDLRELDCEVLLASPALGDTLLALLCQMQDNCSDPSPKKPLPASPYQGRGKKESVPAYSSPDKGRLGGVSSKWQGGLISPIIAAELDAMPITVNVRDNPFYQQIFYAGAEQGKAEGKAEGEQQALAKARLRLEQLLRKQLHLKFGAGLPDWVEAQLAAADSDTLELWAERVLSEATLDGVFNLMP